MAQTGTNVPYAAELLKQGQLVAFATETVYGLGADATNADAVLKIFEAKQRPLFDPLIVHLGDVRQLETVICHQPALLSVLTERFWPGPLTILLPRNLQRISDLVTAGLPDVGIRIPAHPQARELITRAGCPVAAPSANLFGQISPTTATHVDEQLGNAVAYILDGGPCEVGIESTIVRLVDDQHLEVLRYGGLTLEAIQQAVPHASIAKATAVIDDQPVLAPGQLQRHYAPRTPLEISASPACKANMRCGLLRWNESFDDHNFSAVETLCQSTSGDMNDQLKQAAKRLFAAMRRLDAAQLELIIATPFPDVGLGIALNDRLMRASQKSA